MIESIWLKFFRRHEDLKLEFDEKFNLITGRNNAGKTTIFYAIEYCFFGSVASFKKLSQLTQFDSDSMGVQLVFKSRQGDKYKLQRMHKIANGKTKSAKGNFTLKKILSTQNDDGTFGEHYVLSSDFGDHEEYLSIKLLELTGISKRLFEMGIHYYQGSIPQILNGSNKLDIIFGITSAASLSEIFGERALAYSREVSELPTIQILLDQSNKEKKEHELKAKDFEQKLNTIRQESLDNEKLADDIDGLKEKTELLGQVLRKYNKLEQEGKEIQTRAEYTQKIFDDIIQQYGKKSELTNQIQEKNTQIQINELSIQEKSKEIASIRQDIREKEREKVEIESNLKQLSAVQKEKDQLETQSGNIDQIKEKIEGNRTAINSISEEINVLKEKEIQYHAKIRDLEHQKGDIEGILQRREKSKDQQACEYCGALIDASTINSDIDKFREKIDLILQDIREIENNIGQNADQIKNMNANERRFNNENTDFTHQQQLIENALFRLKTIVEKGGSVEKLHIIEGEIHEKEEVIIKAEQAMENFQEQRSIVKEKIFELQKRIQDVELAESRAAEAKNAALELNETLIEVKKQIQEEITALNYSFLRCAIRNEEYTNFISEQVQQLFNSKIVVNTENFERISQIKEKLREFLLSKSSELRTMQTFMKSNLRDMETFLFEAQNRILAIDRDIASNTAKITHLTQINEIVLKYRKYQKIFDVIQNKIRQNAASALEQRILENHRRLSVDNEFTAIKVDPEDYSVGVSPQNGQPGDFYPANLYQGGGHRLILGLAYKLGLGDLIGSPAFLLIDEPTEFMDKHNRENLMKQLASNSTASQIFLITHQDRGNISIGRRVELVK